MILNARDDISKKVSTPDICRVDKYAGLICKKQVILCFGKMADDFIHLHITRNEKFATRVNTGNA
jgi:hypothetical protein